MKHAALTIMNILFFSLCQHLLADEQVITKDNKTVVLHTNNTWEYVAGTNAIEETFSQMSREEFWATKPTQPVVMRVRAKLAAYYNYEFRDAEKEYWSIDIRDYKKKNNFDNYASIGVGYLKKDFKIAPEVFNVIKDGKLHKMVLAVSYLPNAKSKEYFLVLPARS